MQRTAKSGIILVCIAMLSGLDLPSDLPLPEKRPEAQTLQFNETSTPEIAEIDDTGCLKELADIGARFEVLPDITGENGCVVRTPLNVTAIVPNISLKPETAMNCRSVLAFAKWVRNAVIPAAIAFAPDESLIAITHASTYVCRPRNNEEGAKLSEHALGNAIDISALTFSSGKIMKIEPRDRTGTSEEAFQKALRFTACQYFTTVIGPFSDAHHADHLHLDLAQRRGGYRLCRFPELPQEAAE